MEISIEGIDAIKNFEGLFLKAYKCPAGVWTIGWGCTDGVHQGMVITTAAAEYMLRDELKKFEDAVNRLVRVPLTQNQFDALVSFSYNVGVSALERSTLLKKLNAKNYAAVPAELKRWTHAGGVELAGLVKRRAAEAALWARPGPTTPLNEPMAQRIDEPGGQKTMLQTLLGALFGAGPTNAAGVTVSGTTTGTNIIGMAMGVLVAVLSGATGNNDIAHYISMFAGAFGAVAAMLNQLHILNASNANTLAQMAEYAAQIKAAADKADGGNAAA